MKSNLPDFNEVKSLNTMSMRRLKLSEMPVSHETLALNVVRKGKSAPMQAPVYRIDNEEFNGYLPSKVWYRDDDIHFLFYTSTAITPEQKPFGTNTTYVVACEVDSDMVIEYEAGLRIFIDQVHGDEETIYVFMFDQLVYDELVERKTKTEPIPVEITDDLIRLVNATLKDS